jgi:predicted nuclease with TOPRIM domain
MKELTPEEFERRLAADTQRLQEETGELREHRSRLEHLLQRKQALISRLGGILTEVTEELRLIQARVVKDILA